MATTRDTDKFDFFVSYAKADNTTGWVTEFVKELKAEHAKFFPDLPPLKEFFDKKDIEVGRDWEHTLLHGIAQSRMFLAFISPNYFASDWCRREWRAWIDTEIAKHILTEGVRPVYLVEVPGFIGKGALDDNAVALKVAELCGVPAPYEVFLASTAPVVKQVRRRQLLTDFTKPFADEGIDALRRDDLHRVLSTLAQDLNHHAQLVSTAATSETTVPPYNKMFSGRIDELLELRKRLKDDQAGVVCGVHGLGGIGKTELALTYAHAFASAYPGGRFLIPCDGKESLQQAVLCLGDFHDIQRNISDDERKTTETYFAAVARCLAARLADKGHILLVLDNVSDSALVSPQQIDCLTTLGPKLHLLATTRLLPPTGGNWLTLSELPDLDALSMLEKHRPLVNDADRVAAGHIVKRLGGFTLAVELVAAYLAAHPGSDYVVFADGLGLQDLEDIAGDEDVELRRHNHERRLSAVFGPVLQELKPIEHRLLEYAAHLPPEYVVLPWLRELVGKDFPEILQPTRLVADPWRELWQRLLRLALFSRVDGEASEPNLLRMHRLVGEMVRSNDHDAENHINCLTTLARERCAFLEEESLAGNNRWEVEPLSALAHLLLDEKVWDHGPWIAKKVAMQWKEIGKYNDAANLLRREIEVLETILGADDLITITEVTNLGLVLYLIGDWVGAELLYQRAYEASDRLLGPEHPITITTMNNMAELMAAKGDYDNAEQLFRCAMGYSEQAFGPEHRDTLMVAFNIAGILDSKGDLDNAKELYENVLEVRKRVLGFEHSDTLSTMNNLAFVLVRIGDDANAELLHHQTLEIRERVLGSDHPDTLSSVNNLAGILEKKGDVKGAKVLYKRAMDTREQVLGNDHPKTLVSVNNLAGVLAHIGDFNSAAPLFRRALVGLMKISATMKSPHPNLSDITVNYAKCLVQQGLSRKDIRCILDEIGFQYGFRLDGGTL